MKTIQKILPVAFSFAFVIHTSKAQNAPTFISKSDSIKQALPFSTRYCFSTNALSMNKGDNYVVTHLWGPEVHFAASDRLSVGVMSTWIASPFIGAIKYSIPTSSDKLHFGIGTLFGSTGYINQFKGYGGLHWAMMTIGSRENNITLSGGYSYLDPGAKFYDRMIPGDYALDTDIPSTREQKFFTAPVIGLAGILKVGEKASLFIDAMAFFSSPRMPNTESRTTINIQGIAVNRVSEVASNVRFFYIMPGMRFQKSPTKAFQVSLAGVSIFRPGDEVQTIPIPMCAWFVKF